MLCARSCVWARRACARLVPGRAPDWGRAHPTPVVQRERTRLVVAAVAALVGLVWILQGLGAPIGRSFMIGDLRWTAAGLILVALAAIYAARGARRSG